jgi:hypothetical protein
MSPSALSPAVVRRVDEPFDLELRAELLGAVRQRRMAKGKLIKKDLQNSLRLCLSRRSGRSYRGVFERKLSFPSNRDFQFILYHKIGVKKVYPSKSDLPVGLHFLPFMDKVLFSSDFIS